MVPSFDDTRLQSDARHEYRRHKGVAGSDQSVSVETPLRADLEPNLAQHSHGDSEGPPDRPTGTIAQISRVGLH